MEPFGYLSAMSATRQSVYSAQPDAPVVPERPQRWRGVARTLSRSSVRPRRFAALGLRRIADRVEPRDVCARLPECS
jgi:hypothetical protein